MRQMPTSQLEVGGEVAKRFEKQQRNQLFPSTREDQLKALSHFGQAQVEIRKRWPMTRLILKNGS